jgi:hypothetical protein
MKRLAALGPLVALAILGCGRSGPKSQGSTVIFQKKIACANEGKKLEKDTAEQDAALAQIGELDFTYRVFYSPRRDSCLIAHRTVHTLQWRGGGPEGSAQIDDLLNQTIVWHKDYPKLPAADDVQTDIEKEISVEGLESR